MTRTSGSIGGISASALTLGPKRQRLVPDTANSFYIVAKNVYGTVWAHHFTRNSGGSGGSDTGGTWPAWRYAGTKELSAYADNPVSATPLFTYSDDAGAQDYALNAASGQFLGSYHGGDSLSASGVFMDGIAIDPTVACEGSQFAVHHVSTATNSGNSFTIELRVTVRSADGNLSFHVPTLSSNVTTFTKPFVGMVIGTGVWDEAAIKLQGGSAAINVPIPVGTSFLLTTYEAAMRQSSSGRVIRVRGNHPQASWFRRTKIVRDGTRSKLYFEGTGSVSLTGRHNFQWTVEFEKGGAAGAQATLPASLVSNGDFPSDLSGWTNTHTATGGSVTQTGGVCRFTRGTANDSRLIQGVSGLTVGGVYLLTGEETTSAGAQANMGLTSASNGSTTTPAPAFSPDTDDANGYNARIVIPTLTTHYVMLQQVGGTAGQTTDFDNVGFYKLANAI